MWGDHMWGWAGGWGWFWPMHLLWWVFVVVCVVLLLRRFSGGRREGGEDRAVAILRERYARGEIDAAQFNEGMRVLKGGPAPPGSS